jgi:succinate dehydrogenase / fumarate reductase, membrane anchor subunit
MSSLRTPLSRAKGLGSAKEGVHHFLIERITAAALVPLFLWFAYSLVRLAGADYETVTAWVGSPLPAVLLILLIATGFWHGALGVQVILEDYMQPEWLKFVSIIFVKFIAIVLAGLGIFAVLRIALGG